MSNLSEPMAVHIMDREFRVTCTAEEKEALQQAALYLDRQMREMRDRGRGMSLESIAIMAALNLSDEVLKLRRQVAEHHDYVDVRIQALADRLDQDLVDESLPPAVD